MLDDVQKQMLLEISALNDYQYRVDEALDNLEKFKTELYEKYKHAANMKPDSLERDLRDEFINDLLRAGVV